MEVTQDIKLNINDTGDRYVVTVKQGDTGRILNVTMMDDQTELTIPSTATVSVRVLKSDGTSVDDTATVSDGKALVEITEQMTAVAGYAKADVSVASDGKIVSTATFLLKVGEIPLGVEIVSQNEFTQLTELIASASAYESRIGDLEDNIETKVSAENTGMMLELTWLDGQTLNVYEVYRADTLNYILAQKQDSMTPLTTAEIRRLWV